MNLRRHVAFDSREAIVDVGRRTRKPDFLPTAASVSRKDARHRKCESFPSFTKAPTTSVSPFRKKADIANKSGFHRFSRAKERPSTALPRRRIASLVKHTLIWWQ
jgi:hypothetical protein